MLANLVLASALDSEAAFLAVVVLEESELVVPEALAGWAEGLKELARDRFGFQNLDVKSGQPERTVSVRSGERPLFEIELRAVELEGTAPTRQVAALLAALSSPGGKPLHILESMKLKRLDSSWPFRVEVQIKWLVATAAPTPISKQFSALVKSPQEGEYGPVAPGSWTRSVVPMLHWGRREEPFQESSH